MIEQLIKKNKFSNLTLLKSFTANPIQTIDSLKQSIAISETSIKKLIPDLNNDLILYTSEQYQILKKESNYVISSTNNSNIDLTNSYHTLRLAYLNSSATFQLLIFLTVNTKNDIPTISEYLYVSKAHFYRLLTKLTLFLSHFNLDIQNIQGSLQISGDEIMIRSVLIVIVATTHQTIEWPFEQFPKELITSLPNYKNLKRQLPPNSHYYLTFIFAVNTIRLRKGFLLNNIHVIHADPILEILRETNDLTKSFDQFPPNFPLDKIHSKFERDFFNIFIRLTIANVDTKEQKIEFGKCFSTSEHPITRYCSSLCTTFFSHFALEESTSDYAEFLYYSVLYHMAEFYVDSSILSLLKLNSKLPDLLNIYPKANEIFNFFLSFNKNYLSLDNSQLTFSEEFIKFFSHTALLFLRMKQKTHLSIHVFYSTNIYGEEFLKERILCVLSDQAIRFTDKPEEADLLISNSSSHYPEKIPHYFLPDIYDYQALNKLCSFVQEMFFAKRISF